MMFRFASKRRCVRGDPRLAAMLGLLSALMLAGAAFLERYEGAHEWLILSVMISGLLIGLGLIRFITLDQDGRE